MGISCVGCGDAFLGGFKWILTTVSKYKLIFQLKQTAKI
jgi:hypothetical protein